MCQLGRHLGIFRNVLVNQTHTYTCNTETRKFSWCQLRGHWHLWWQSWHHNDLVTHALEQKYRYFFTNFSSLKELTAVVSLTTDTDSDGTFRQHFCILTTSGTTMQCRYFCQDDGTLISIYPQTSNISRTFVGNKMVVRSDEVGSSPVGAAPTTSSFSPGLSGLDKDNCKMIGETFKFMDLVRLILEVWW